MTRTEDTETRLWGHFNDAMKHADEAFAAADRAFNEAETYHPKQKCRTGTGNQKHSLRFSAHTLRERWRLTKRFFKMGCRVLATGRTEFCFRER